MDSNINKKISKNFKKKISENFKKKISENLDYNSVKNSDKNLISKLVILGSGSKNGIPNLNCVFKNICKNCSDAIKDSKKIRFTSSLLIKTEKEDFIIDTTHHAYHQILKHYFDKKEISHYRPQAILSNASSFASFGLNTYSRMSGCLNGSFTSVHVPFIYKNIIESNFKYVFMNINSFGIKDNNNNSINNNSINNNNINNKSIESNSLEKNFISEKKSFNYTPLNTSIHILPIQTIFSGGISYGFIIDHKFGYFPYLTDIKPLMELEGLEVLIIACENYDYFDKSDDIENSDIENSDDIKNYDINNYHNVNNSYGLSFSQIKKLVSIINPKRVILTGINHNFDEELFYKNIEKHGFLCELGYDMMEI